MYFFLIHILLTIIDLLLAFQLSGWEQDGEFQIYDLFEKY